MGSEKLKDLPKVMQSLSPSPSDSRATSCPATWSCGSFPREPRSSVLGRVKEANEAPVPPVHGEEWLALFRLCREAAAARRFGSSSRAPTRLLPPALGRVSSAQCLLLVKSRRSRRPARPGPRAPQALSASTCLRRPEAGSGQLQVQKVRGTRTRENERSVLRRAAPGSGRLRGPGACRHCPKLSPLLLPPLPLATL